MQQKVSFTGVGSRGKAPALLPQHQQEEPPADQQKPLLEMAVNNGRKLSKLSEMAVNKGRKLSEEITVKSAAVAESCWESFQRDVGEAADTSYDMITLWLCPMPFRRLEEAEQWRHWIVRWNPGFWMSYLPLVVCVLSGKYLHSFWGQGGKVRDDETLEEHRVRMHWIYCLDGPIAGLTLLDLVDVLFDVPMYEQRKFQVEALLSWVMTLTVTAAYVLANTYFLFVMSRRSLVGVRLVIICQTVFAVGLLNMLVAGLLRNKSSRRYGDYFFGTWVEFITWCGRLTMVLFMLAAAHVYSRLWNAYKVDPRADTEVQFHLHGQYLRKECRQYAIIPIGAVVMWTLLGLAYYLDDDMFWDALV